MTSNVQTRCDLLVENRNAISKGFLIENSLIKIVTALIFAQDGEVVDVDHLKECRDILRKKQGMFSDLRSNNELVVSAKMAKQGDPEGYLEDIIRIYKMLHEGKVIGSSYQVLAALSICDAGKVSEAEEIVNKTKEIMKGMKAAHPFLTNDEDTCFAVLLAMTKKDTAEILDELEETYKDLKKNFAFHDNAVYSLAQVLTVFEGNSLEKSKKAMDIFNAFKDEGVNYGKNQELASIGSFIHSNMENHELVREIIDTHDFLKNQKGFGMLDAGKTTRLMIAGLLVTTSNNAANITANAAVIEGAIATVIAEETAMMLAMVAIVSGTISSSSSNS